MECIKAKNPAPDFWRVGKSESATASKQGLDPFVFVVVSYRTPQTPNPNCPFRDGRSRIVVRIIILSVFVISALVSYISIKEKVQRPQGRRTHVGGGGG